MLCPLAFKTFSTLHASIAAASDGVSQSTPGKVGRSLSRSFGVDWAEAAKRRQSHEHESGHGAQETPHGHLLSHRSIQPGIIPQAACTRHQGIRSFWNFLQRTITDRWQFVKIVLSREASTIASIVFIGILEQSAQIVHWELGRACEHRSHPAADSIVSRSLSFTMQPRCRARVHLQARLKSRGILLHSPGANFTHEPTMAFRSEHASLRFFGLLGSVSAGDGVNTIAGRSRPALCRPHAAVGGSRGVGPRAAGA